MGGIPLVSALTDSVLLTTAWNILQEEVLNFDGDLTCRGLTRGDLQGSPRDSTRPGDDESNRGFPLDHGNEELKTLRPSVVPVCFCPALISALAPFAGLTHGPWQAPRYVQVARARSDINWYDGEPRFSWWLFCVGPSRLRVGVRAN